jgi:hypothetical protein
MHQLDDVDNGEMFQITGKRHWSGSLLEQPAAAEKKSMLGTAIAETRRY